MMMVVVVVVVVVMVVMKSNNSQYTSFSIKYIYYNTVNKQNMTPVIATTFAYNFTPVCQTYMEGISLKGGALSIDRLIEEVAPLRKSDNGLTDHTGQRENIKMLST